MYKGFNQTLYKYEKIHIIDGDQKEMVHQRAVHIKNWYHILSEKFLENNQITYY